MLRTLAFAALLAFTASSALSAPALDAKGKCRDGGKFVAASMCAAPAAAATTTTGGAPNCKKGKPCGHSCIAQDKVCHIK